MILGIDTVGGTGGVAVWRGSGAPLARDLGEPGRHAEALVPAITELLEAAGASWHDLDAIAVNVGPGSFTGIRVGVAAALGMGESRGVAVYGVGCLDVLTRAWYDTTRLEPDAYAIAGVDVRRGEVVLAGYGVDPDGTPRCRDTERLVSVEDPGLEPPPGCPVIGDIPLWPDRTDLDRVRPRGSERAAAVAWLGAREGCRGEPVPRYARPADARPRRR